MSCVPSFLYLLTSCALLYPLSTLYCIHFVKGRGWNSRRLKGPYLQPFHETRVWVEVVFCCDIVVTIEDDDKMVCIPNWFLGVFVRCVQANWEIRQLYRSPEVSILFHENCKCVPFLYFFPFDRQADGLLVGLWVMSEEWYVRPSGLRSLMMGNQTKSIIMPTHNSQKESHQKKISLQVVLSSSSSSSSSTSINSGLIWIFSEPVRHDVSNQLQRQFRG